MATVVLLTLLCINIWQQCVRLPPTNLVWNYEIENTESETGKRGLVLDLYALQMNNDIKSTDILS